MTREEFAEEVARLTQMYHDAFLVDLFGVADSGLDEARIDELREAGLIEGDDGMMIDGLRPFELMMGAGHVFSDDPERIDELRQYGIEEFAPLISLKINDLRSTPREVQGIVETASVPPLPQGIAPSMPPPPPPEWMSTAERGAYQRTVMRAGEYARGLGNALAAELSDVVAEGWQGEEIIEEVIPEQRDTMLAILRDEAANEQMTSRDARRLAGTLADRTGYYAHNWFRIAQTELQASHNEGRVIYAQETYGDEARVARIPESGACAYCVEAFTDETGKPRIFSVTELRDNGVNVGRTRSEWLPTVFPLHPNCRCDTITVPAGFIVLEDGRLRRPDVL